MKKNIEIHLVDLSTTLPLPYADEGIHSGFPSTAKDYMEQAIDLNKIQECIHIHFTYSRKCFIYLYSCTYMIASLISAILMIN